MKDKMKAMKYSATRRVKVLYSGFYKNYEFYIMNFGPYPTVYVNVKNNKLLNKKNYDEMDIDVHGGLNYSNDHLYTNKKKIDGWFIGWDYANIGDYSGYDLMLSILSHEKKWTTEEIYEDVKDVIEQCINYKEGEL